MEVEVRAPQGVVKINIKDGEVQVDAKQTRKRAATKKAGNVGVKKIKKEPKAQKTKVTPVKKAATKAAQRNTTTNGRKSVQKVVPKAVTKNKANNPKKSKKTGTKPRPKAKATKVPKGGTKFKEEPPEDDLMGASTAIFRQPGPTVNASGTALGQPLGLLESGDVSSFDNSRFGSGQPVGFQGPSSVFGSIGTSTNSMFSGSTGGRAKIVTVVNNFGSDHSYDDIRGHLNPMKQIASVSYPENSDLDTENDNCAVCLEPPVHPTLLECGHRYCYLCAKGLVEGGNRRCSLCRRPITPGFLKNPALMRPAVKDEKNDDVSPQWFYQSGNGRDWWRFEERNNDELEEYFKIGLSQVEMLICGRVYVIDYSAMVQYRKDGSGRRRSIKRAKGSMESLGVAGLMR